MITQADIIDIIKDRYSCRTFQEQALTEQEIQAIREAIQRIEALDGPFAPAGSTRFSLQAAIPGDTASLKGLGTYGFIKNPQAFLVAAIKDSSALEDAGWRLEQLVLDCHSRGIHSCWLGGSFRRSRFAQAVEADFKDFAPDGSWRIPAVIALGRPAADKDPRNSFARRTIGGKRKSWGDIFFIQAKTGAALSRLEDPALAEPWSLALEMLRLGPSASNKQPWRVVWDQEGQAFHFYLCRSPGYRDGFAAKLVKAEDIQRVDSGIGVCHFQAAVEYRGLTGSWLKLSSPASLVSAFAPSFDEKSDAQYSEYVISFAYAPVE